MKFSVDKSVEILRNTPDVLDAMLVDLSSEWTESNEGPETWSAYDIVGHLIHGEKTDWIPRMQIIMSEESNKHFEPFDRFAQFENSKGKTLQQLLAEFKELRTQNISALQSKNIKVQDFNKIGIHPAFGEVTLANLLATWVVHDLNHIAQIARVMAKQYKQAVGPWPPYLKILQQ